jgi:hypothetical protein
MFQQIMKYINVRAIGLVNVINCIKSYCQKYTIINDDD